MDQEPMKNFGGEFATPNSEELHQVPSLWPVILGYLGMYLLPIVVIFLVAFGVFFIDPNLVKDAGKLSSSKLSNVLMKNILVQLLEFIFFWTGMLLSVLYVSNNYHISLRELVVWKIRWSRDIPIAIGLYFCAAIGGGLYLRLYQHFAHTPAQNVGNATTVFHPDSRWNWIFAILVVVFAPVIEEIFFRGLAFYVISARFGSIVAIISTAFFFAIAHVQTTLASSETTIGVVFVAGLVFATARSITNRLGPSLLAHMLFNGVAAYLLYR